MAIQERVKSQLLEADAVQSASSLAEDDSVTEALSVGTSGAQESTLSQFGRAFKVSYQPCLYISVKRTNFMKQQVSDDQNPVSCNG